MIFRLSFLIPVLIIAGSIYFLTTFFSEGVVKSVLESSIPGLKISESNLSVEENFDFSMQAEVFSETDNEKIASFENARIIAQKRPLGFKKLYVDEISAKGIYIHPRVWKEVQKETQEAAKDVILKDGEDGKKEIAVPKINFKDMGAREILERISGSRELKTEAELSDLDALAKRLEKKWVNKKNALSNDLDLIKTQSNAIPEKWKKNNELNEIKADLKSNVNTFNQIKNQKFSINNIQEIAKSANSAKNLKSNFNSLKSKLDDVNSKMKTDINFFKENAKKVKELKTIDNELREDLKNLKLQSDAVLEAADTDRRMIKKELDIKSFDAQKITRLLFGKEWEEKLIYYLGMWDKVRGYLPKLNVLEEADARSEEAKKFKRIDPIEFERNPEYANLYIKKLAYEGKLKFNQNDPEVNVEGTFYHITDDESVERNPLKAEVEAKLADNQGVATIKAVYSQLIHTVDFRNLKFHLKGSPMKGKSWGNGGTQVLFNNGLLNLKLVLDLSSETIIKGKGEIVVDNAQVEPGVGVKEIIRSSLKQAVEKMLTKAVPFEVSYNPETKDIDFKVSSELDDLFKDILKGTMNTLVDENKHKVITEFNQSLQAKLQSKVKNPSLQNAISGISNGLIPSLNSTEGTLAKNENSYLAILKNIETDNALVNKLMKELDFLNGDRKNLEKRLIQQQKDKAKREAEAKLREAEAKARAEAERRKQEAQRQLEEKLQREKEERERKVREEIERKKREEREKLKNKVKDQFKDQFKKFGF